MQMLYFVSNQPRSDQLSKCLTNVIWFHLQRIANLWAMVREMTSLPLQTSANPIIARTAQEMQVAFVKQARGFLEQR